MTDPRDPVVRLADADREATVARQRLAETVTALQVRLAPARLADEATRDVRAAASASVDAVARYRGALLGVGTALTLFMVRRPLLRFLRRRTEP